MTDFLTELEELFSEKQISHVLDDFKKSSFFREHYLTQTFKKIVKNKNGEKVEIQPSRFKKKSYYLNKSGYPIQLNQELTKKLKNGNEIKVVKNHLVNRWKGNKKKMSMYSTNNNVYYNKPLKLSNIELQETKELKMFIDGSNENPEQFETLSAEKLYKEWLLLRLSDIKKENWQIMNYVFFLFINQISCILNSYILYRNINNKLEVEKYKSYLNSLNEFTKNGGLYKDLLQVHFLFCEWYDIRLMFAIEHKKKRLIKITKQNSNEISNLFKKTNSEKAIAFKTIKYNNSVSLVIGNLNLYNLIGEFFNKTLQDNNFSLLIFTSYFQNPKKSNQLYACPIIPILGIPYKTHDGFIYSPKIQLLHDYNHVKFSLIPFFEHLYPNQNINSNKKIDDIQVFFEKMLFLKKLNEMEINNEELNNAHYFLWWYLHEKEFLYLSKIKKKDEHNKNMLFFDINLFESELKELLDLLEKKNNRLKLNSNAENFTQLKSSINLLFQVCNKTLHDSNKKKLFNKIKNETIQFYNNGNLNNIRAVVNGNNNVNNTYTKKLPNTSTLSKQRNAFIKGIVKYPNGLPLTNTNFSN